MSKQWKYLFGIVSVAIAIVGFAGLVVYCDSSAGLLADSTKVATQLEVARLLCEAVVVVPIGHFAVAATPFQVVYVVLSIILAVLALLVCLIRVFLDRYVHLSPSRPMIGFVTVQWLNH